MTVLSSLTSKDIPQCLEIKALGSAMRLRSFEASSVNIMRTCTGLLDPERRLRRWRT